MNKINNQIHILPSISVGGAPINVLRLIKELKSQNYNCCFEIWSPNDNDDFKNNLKKENILFQEIPKIDPFSIVFLKNIVKKILLSDKERSQFVTHGRGCGLIIKPLIIFFRRKSIHFFRGFTPSYGLRSAILKKILVFLESIICKFGIVICVGKDEFNLVEKYLRPNSQKLLYNPVTKIQWDRDGKKLEFSFIGRRSYQKGFDRAIQMAEKLEDISFNWHGNKESNFHDDFKIPKNLSLFPSSDPEFIFSNCDAVIIVSRWEGASTVAIECLLSEKPLIALKCPGVDEFFIEDLNDKNLNESLAELEVSLRDFDLESNLKTAKKISSKFKEEINSKKIIKEYVQICGI